MSEPIIQIAVAVHKPYRMPADPIYLPIQVGAALHPDVDLVYQRDDEGDNISDKNDSYSELTAMYWMWKNSDADYKGLVHYRRHLGTSDSARSHAQDRFERIATYEDVYAALQNADVVLPRRRNYYIESIGSHWNHTQPEEQLTCAKQVITEKTPEYADAFGEALRAKGAHMFNMCVMRADLFDEYCAWLFPLLEEMTERLADKEYSSFEQRWPGRVSELMMDPWLSVNGVKYVELPTTSPEPVNWGKKASGFLQAKFLGKKYEESF